MNYYQEVCTCLENIGIIISGINNSDIDLTEYQIDSIMFVSLIVEFESHFNIEIPDQYLNYQTITSLRGLSNLIEVLCLEKENEGE